MKTMAGALSFACLNRSRTRDAPMPTIASTNSEADNEKNAACGLARDCAREKRLARPRWAVQEHAAGNAGAEPGVALRVLEEVDDLDELLLRLVDAGDVVERDALLPALLEAAGGRPAEATEDAATPGLPPRQPDEEPDQYERGREPEEEAQQKATARIRRARVDDDLLLRQHLRQPGAIDERRNLRLEPVDLDGLVVARWVVRHGLLQLALDRVLTRGDRLDVPGLDLLEEERLVRAPAGDPAARR